jgi:hypothetical protein
LFDQSSIGWIALSKLYRIAPLGDKTPDELKLAFSNSRHKCFVFDDGVLIGAGRALAWRRLLAPMRRSGPSRLSGRGLGTAIIVKLKELSAGHRKIILYANPGKEGFYRKLGFTRMRTAMAIFKDQDRAIREGLVDGP